MMHWGNGGHGGVCSHETLLVKSQICRKRLGHAMRETQKDRDHAPMKCTLVPVEIPRCEQRQVHQRAERIVLEALQALDRAPAGLTGQRCVSPHRQTTRRSTASRASQPSSSGASGSD